MHPRFFAYARSFLGRDTRSTICCSRLSHKLYQKTQFPMSWWVKFKDIGDGMTSELELGVASDNLTMLWGGLIFPQLDTHKKIALKSPEKVRLKDNNHFVLTSDIKKLFLLFLGIIHVLFLGKCESHILEINFILRKK